MISAAQHAFESSTCCELELSKLTERAIVSVVFLKVGESFIVFPLYFGSHRYTTLPADIIRDWFIQFVIFHIATDCVIVENLSVLICQISTFTYIISTVWLRDAR